LPIASADRIQSSVVYATGLVQGIALVTLPAASSILTGRHGFSLTSSQYGSMFVPQVLAAIAAALFAVYQVGYGIAAFAVGPLLTTGIPLAMVFGAAGAVAVLLCVGTFVVTSGVNEERPRHHHRGRSFACHLTRQG
jgi:hypothetical protein